MDRNFLALELDKVLKKLSQEACSERAKEKIINILPDSNIKNVNRLLDETLAAYTLSCRFGGPSFYGLKNVVESVKRAS